MPYDMFYIIAHAAVSSSTTISLPTGFMDDVLGIVSNFFATNGFLHDPLMVGLAVSLALLAVGAIIGFFHK